MFSKKAETTEPIKSEDAPAPTAVDPVASIDAPAPEAPADAPEKASEDRFEEYDAVKPDGEVVHIRRNIDTGATEIVK